MSKKYQVIVGNIGTVYDGESQHEASVEFTDYCKLSLSMYGRVAGEEVSMMESGDLKHWFRMTHEDFISAALDLVKNRPDRFVAAGEIHALAKEVVERAKYIQDNLNTILYGDDNVQD